MWQTPVQVISLGTHAFAGCKPDPALVMEVMPAMLARRSFPCLRSDGMLDPGFRESPDPSHDMAIVFVKVRSSAGRLAVAFQREAESFQAALCLELSREGWLIAQAAIINHEQVSAGLM